jgi:outer membrane protein
MTRALTALALPLLFALPALAQDMGMGMGMGMGAQDPSASSGTMGAAGGAQAGAPPQGGAMGAPQAVRVQGPSQAGPDQLFGLAPSDSPPVLSLDDALALAAASNFDLRIAHEKVRQQEAQVRRAWSLLLPQVTLGGNYTFNCIGNAGGINCNDQTVEFVSAEQLEQQALLFGSLGEIMGQLADFEQDPMRQDELRGQSRALRDAEQKIVGQKDTLAPIVIQPAHVVNGSLTLSVPILNGRGLPLLQNAYSAVDAVSLAGAQAREGLLLAVSRAYYMAFAAKKMLTIASEQRESAIRHRDAVKSRVELDALPPLTLRRAELDVIRAGQSVRQADAGYKSALGAVGQLAGIDTIFDVVAPPPQPAVELEGTPEQLISRAFAARSDLRAQRIALHIAERNRLDSWMMFLPTVNLVAQGRGTSNVQGFVPTPFTGALMLQASLPLYDGGARYASLDETGSRIREELLRVRQIEQRIQGQVRGNVEDLRLRTQGLELSREAVVVAREAQAQAEALYEVGAATPLDVSDANLALFMSEVDLARAELEVEQARLGLAYVVGAPPVSSAQARPLADEEAAAAKALLERKSP